MKRFLAVFLSFVLVLSFAACGADSGKKENQTDNTGTKTQEPADADNNKNNESNAAGKSDTESEPKTDESSDGFYSVFEKEVLSENAMLKAHIKCFNNNKQLWSYDTEAVYASELDNLQEIGFTSYGYLFIEEGTVICIDCSNRPGEILWINDDFKGASALWDFDEDENLYICGYYAPLLTVISPEGKTLCNYQDFELVSGFYWPDKLEYKDDIVEINFSSNDMGLGINPATGRLVSVNYGSKLGTLLTGTWVDDQFDPDLYLSIFEDGSYIVFKDDDDETKIYKGSWTIGDDELNNGLGLLQFSVSEHNDTSLMNLTDFGDYSILEFTSSKSNLVMKMAQLNNGDGMFSLLEEEYSPVIYKINDDAVLNNPFAPASYISDVNYDCAVGSWECVKCEIEGYEFLPEQEGMEMEIEIKDDYTVDFEVFNPNDTPNEQEYNNMAINIVEEELYPGIVTNIYGSWYMEFKAGEEDSFSAALTEYDTLEVLWYRGTFTQDSYPSVMYMKFEREFE